MHVLVVHAVVVLVPAAVLAAVLVALWPAWRRRFGPAAVVLTALATALIPVATSSGEGLEHQLPRTAALVTHTELGDELLPFAAGLLVAMTALVVLEYRRGCSAGSEQWGPVTGEGSGTGRGTVVSTRVRTVVVMLAGVTVVLAAVTAVQVVRIGDSGARQRDDGARRPGRQFAHDPCQSMGQADIAVALRSKMYEWYRHGRVPPDVRAPSGTSFGIFLCLVRGGRA